MIGSQKLVVVHGKGGVGRTTVASALALASARSGALTGLVEIQAQVAAARMLGVEPSYEPMRLTRDLHLMNLSLSSCLSDFGRRKLKIDRLARWFFESRVMTGFIEAVPGLQDVIQLGKVENMINEPLTGEPVWQRVILDGPATGHGLSLLAAARSMGEMTRVGPFYDLAHIIERFLADPEATAHVLVVLPEALPVQEGLELAASLADQGTPPSAILVNQVRQAPLPNDPSTARLRDRLSTPATEAEATLVEVLRRSEALVERQGDALAQLRQGVTAQLGAVPIVKLPWRQPAPSSVESLLPLAEPLAQVVAP